MTPVPSLPPLRLLLPPRRRRRLRRRDEAGQASVVFVVVVLVAALAAVGVVVDSGRAFGAWRRATTAAEGAALAGARTPTAPALYAGGPEVLDPARARAAAEAHLALAGVAGTVAVAGTEVVVVTTAAESPVVLGAFGVGPFELRGHATARAERA